MKMTRRSALKGVAAAALIGLAGSPVRAEQNGGQILRQWYKVVLRLVRHTATYSPPVASRAFAYLGVAAYQAVASGSTSLVSLAGQLNGLKALIDAVPAGPPGPGGPGKEGCSPWEAPQSESARGREAQGPEVALRPRGDGFGAGGSRCQDSWSLMGPCAPRAPGLRYQVPGPRPGLSSRAQGAGEVAPIDRDGLQYQKHSAHDGPVMRHA